MRSKYLLSVYDKGKFRSCAVRRTQERANACAKSTLPRLPTMTIPALRSLLRYTRA